jgi:hypothetical protein
MSSRISLPFAPRQRLVNFPSGRCKMSVPPLHRGKREKDNSERDRERDNGILQTQHMASDWLTQMGRPMYEEWKWRHKNFHSRPSIFIVALTGILFICHSRGGNYIWRRRRGCRNCHTTLLKHLRHYWPDLQLAFASYNNICKKKLFER